jgi:hypothetical protein
VVAATDNCTAVGQSDLSRSCSPFFLCRIFDLEGFDELFVVKAAQSYTLSAVIDGEYTLLKVDVNVSAKGMSDMCCKSIVTYITLPRFRCFSNSPVLPLSVALE